MMTIPEFAAHARPKPAKPHIVIRRMDVLAAAHSDQENITIVESSAFYAVIYRDRAESQSNRRYFFGWVSQSHPTGGELMRHLQRSPAMRAPRQ